MFRMFFVLWVLTNFVGSKEKAYAEGNYSGFEFPRERERERDHITIAVAAHTGSLGLDIFIYSWELRDPGKGDHR